MSNLYMYIQMWGEPGAESSQGSRHRDPGEPGERRGGLESRGPWGGRGSALADKERILEKKPNVVTFL